jgi:Arc/MetJ family transcription regulator
MQTNIALDDELIERAQQLTGVETKNEAVQAALRAFISLREQVEGSNPRPQAAVVESLERSLIENAEIWTELAKH